MRLPTACLFISLFLAVIAADETGDPSAGNVAVSGIEHGPLMKALLAPAEDGAALVREKRTFKKGGGGGGGGCCQPCGGCGGGGYGGGGHGGGGHGGSKGGGGFSGTYSQASASSGSYGYGKKR